MRTSTRNVPSLARSLAKAKRDGWSNWIKTKADERAVANGCTFDLEGAQRVADFFRRFLRHSKGQWSGEPFELLDWQRDDIIYPLFGWKREDGVRRYRKAYVEIPKKNGKSTLASGIGLYLLAGDGEAGAEVYSAASSQQQASIVHNEAIAMVKASKPLSGALKLNESTKNISYPRTNSFYRALSADASSKEGFNAHGIIADELHVWYGRKLWDALKYACTARRQGLLFVITTAGDDMHSICREQHDYAAGVIKGDVEDDRFFGYIRAAEPTDDINDPEVWRKANPSLGITFSDQDFKADVEEAKRTPTTLTTLKRYRLNIWASSSNPWLRTTDWHSCGRQFNEESLEGRACYAGLDLAMVSDMTALVLLFPEPEAAPPADTADDAKEAAAAPAPKPLLASLLAFFWLPEATAEGDETLSAWARAGHVHLTPGNSTDFAFVKKRILELKETFDIRGLAFDDYHAGELVTSLKEEHGMPVNNFPQTAAVFTGPTAKFERMLLDGQIAHNRHPILNWQAGNVNVRRDAIGNMRPVKPPQGDKRKIDGIVAAIMALGQWMRYPAAAKRSVYESRGVVTI